MKLKPPHISKITASAIGAHGYLPEELPPCFSSIEFGSYIGSLNQNEIKLELDKKNKGKSVAESIDTYGARSGGLIRRYSTPSPIGFLKLALEIERSKQEITNHLKNSELSASQPTTFHKHRAFGLSYWFKHLDELKNSFSKNRWLLKTDISTFYPSIYTHSISWALHGKLESKKNIHNWSLLGNRIDKFISVAQSNETRGIPVGPDTSRVISEIILNPIDKALSAQGAMGFRFMDDYWFFCNSKNEAEEQLGHLQIELMKYRLNVSPVKTNIIEHNSNFDPEWLGEVRSKILNDPHSKEGNQKYKNLLNWCAEKHPRTPAIKYIFISIRNHTKVKKIDMILVELLSECVNLDHVLIPDFIRFLNWKSHRNNNQYDQFVISKFEEWIPKCIRLGFHIEIAWMLWFALEKKWELDREIINGVAEIDSNYITLLILALIDKNLCPPIENILDNEAFDLHEEHDYTGNWLLRYQCALKGWLPPGPLKNIGLLKLYDNGISFFREDIGDGEWALPRESIYGD